MSMLIQSLVTHLYTPSLSFYGLLYHDTLYTCIKISNILLEFWSLAYQQFL